MRFNNKQIFDHLALHIIHACSIYRNKIFPTSQNKAKAINGEETGEIGKQNGIGKEEILTSPIDIENQENVENQPSGRNGLC